MRRYYNELFFHENHTVRGKNKKSLNWGIQSRFKIIFVPLKAVIMPYSIIFFCWFIIFQCLLLLLLSFAGRELYLCQLSFSLFSSFYKATLVCILVTYQKSLLIVEKTVCKISLIEKSFVLFEMQLPSSFNLTFHKKTLKFEISCFYGTFNHFSFLPNSFENTSILNIFKRSFSICFSIDKLPSIDSFFTNQYSFIMRNKIISHLYQLPLIVYILIKNTTQRLSQVINIKSFLMQFPFLRCLFIFLIFQPYLFTYFIDGLLQISRHRKHHYLRRNINMLVPNMSWRIIPLTYHNKFIKVKS